MVFRLFQNQTSPMFLKIFELTGSAKMLEKAKTFEKVKS
jgi:hypothetical protein